MYVYSGILSVFLSFSLILYGCGKKSETDKDRAFRFTKTIIVDGHERSYTINLPSDYYSSTNYALVIAMHGGGGNSRQFESTSKITEKANAANFIVVYPDGIKSTGILGAQTWNAGGCCDYALENNIDDVKFISMLIDELVLSYSIDKRKVYATGHSNGGMLAYRLACELSEKIAAIAPNGCSMSLTTPCNSVRPVPVLHMHSVNDTRVPYNGGIGSGIVNYYFPPVDSVLNVFSMINQCSEQAKLMVDNDHYTLRKWSGCSSGSEIIYYLTKDGGHAWPGGLPGGPNSDIPSVSINANDLIWDFFQQHSLP